ncbi:MAG: anthranilate phosphoribosyltransferase [Gammaproteobacteria bacterium]
MLAEEMDSAKEPVTMRSCIQKVATGPEYSKNLSYDEARAAMELILAGTAEPVQAAVLLIALRMKRETDDENKGILQALIDSASTVTAPVDELVDVADPYDGYTKCLPASPFLAPLLAACGMPAVSHGLDSVGPKYGATHRKVLAAAGLNVDLTPAAAAEQIGRPDIGWAYVDQREFCPGLHDLVPLRRSIVKRPVLTTVEVLVGPIRGRARTHLLTGYVHKAYPRVYAMLARHAGFDSAVIVRGVEGGITPSLQQPANVFYYRDRGEEQLEPADPTSLGIEQKTRAVPLPKDLPAAPRRDDNIATEVDSDAVAAAAAEAGLEALKGAAGATRDSLVYAAALCLHHIGRHDSLQSAAEAARKALDSGAALAHLKAAM